MCYLDDLPSPSAIHARLGQLMREQQLLRRLLRLSQAARDARKLDADQVDNLDVTLADLKVLRQEQHPSGSGVQP